MRRKSNKFPSVTGVKNNHLRDHIFLPVWVTEGLSSGARDGRNINNDRKVKNIFKSKRSIAQASDHMMGRMKRSRSRRRSSDVELLLLGEADSLMGFLVRGTKVGTRGVRRVESSE